ncbi:MAG: AAA family ATPase [Candidatus Dojkabacteria bacterium]|jgi:cytidylate kinase|nr:AAA family ATPase [Candidatus Dojkabacteria bacterium]
MTQSKRKMVLVVGGPGGSGSSTISHMLAQHFKLPRIYAGDLFRKEAKERDIEYFEEFLQQISKGGNSLDLEIDGMLEEYARRGNIVIDSKVFGALAKEKKIPITASIWIDANIHTRVMRHLGRREIKGLRRIPEYLKIKYNLKRRWKIDREKYKRLYKIKYEKPSLYYDIVLDTSRINEEETFKLILEKLKDGGYIKE